MIIILTIRIKYFFRSLENELFNEEINNRDIDDGLLSRDIEQGLEHYLNAEYYFVKYE